jgi:hypothetical protein
MPEQLSDSFDAVVRQLLGATHSPSLAMRAPVEGGVPGEPGFYAWWVRQGAIADVLQRPHPTESERALLYVGISPARETSSQTLRSRVLNNHLNGNTGSSTFRFTLASLLFEKHGWKPLRRATKVVLSPADNAALTAWKRENLTLTWATRARPWEIETDVIAAMQPPLNLAANGGHPFYSTVRNARASFRSAARAGATPAREPKGSLKHVRWYVNERSAYLTDTIFTASPSLAAEAVGDLRWVSPLAAEKYLECWNARFLDKLDLLDRLEAFQAFWPFSGSGTPHWDALATFPTTDGFGVVMVEAKAHRGELVKPDDRAGATDEASLALIKQSCLDARDFYRVPPRTPPWEESFYRVGNRLAHLYWMNREAKVPTWLIWIFFLQRSDMA